MNALQFRNIIASLYNLDRNVLIDAGVVDFGTVGDADWRSARDNPAKFVLALDDVRLSNLWALVEARQPALTDDSVFPKTLKAGDREISQGGISLRDWLAGQALAGILAFPGAVSGNRDKGNRQCAVAAYSYADAVLAERAKAGA